MTRRPIRQRRAPVRRRGPIPAAPGPEPVRLLKPPAAVAVALDTWLALRNKPRAALQGPLGASNVMACTRTCRGEALLSTAQRAAIEVFTDGAITAAMLAGRQAPPSREALKPVPAAPPPVPTIPVPEAESAPAVENTGALHADPRERGDNALFRAYPGAAAVAIKVVKGEDVSPGAARGAFRVLELVGGKARQREEKRREERHATDEQVCAELADVQQKLTHGDVVVLPYFSNAEIPYEGTGLA